MTTDAKPLPRGEFPALSFWVMALGMSMAPSAASAPDASAQGAEPSPANSNDERRRFSPRDFLHVAGE